MDKLKSKLFRPLWGHCTESKPEEVSNKNKENKDVANEGVHKCEKLKERQSCISLYHIIQYVLDSYFGRQQYITYCCRPK